MPDGSRRNRDFIGIFSILITILVGIITLYFALNNPEMGIMLLSLIYFFIVVYFIADYMIGFAKKKMDQINKNSEDIDIIKKEFTELKKNLDIHLEIAKLKTKVESMEKTSKRKGFVDPRIIIVAVILILFYLYLRTLNVVP